MTPPNRDDRRSVWAGVAVLTLAGLTMLVLVAAPLSLEATFFGMYVTGLESPWVAFGPGVAVLLIAGICARAIVRGAIRRWPDHELSFRTGVLAMPVVALCGLIVGLTSDWPPGAMAVVALPAAFTVSMGAAAAWIGRPKAQRSPSSMPSPLSKEPLR